MFCFQDKVFIVTLEQVTQKIIKTKQETRIGRSSFGRQNSKKIEEVVPQYENQVIRIYMVDTPPPKVGGPHDAPDEITEI